MHQTKLTIPEILEKSSKESQEIDEIIASSLSKIDEQEDSIAAFLPEKDRDKRLEQRMAELKAKYPSASSRPDLYGVPVAVKDIFHLNGFKTRAGSQLDPDLLTGKEGYIIKKLRSQGVLFLGKTVTAEFAYFEPGPTRNPHNLEHTPGGSSSGSAAAVAAGYCPLALGTQTIGSVIRPAAFCGIVGFKPSYGRIPLEGLIKCSESADQIGFFTPTVRGMEIAFASVSPARQNKKITEDAWPVLGQPDRAYLNQAEAEGLRNFEASKGVLQKAGYKIKQTAILEEIAEINKTHRILVAYEFAKVHKEWYKEFRDLYRRKTAELIEEGFKINRADYFQARDNRLILRNQIEELMNEKGIDILISPSAPGPAPEGIDSTGNPVMNLPWTNSGLPTITVPSGKSRKGLPFGLQLVSGYNTDEKLLKWADRIGNSLKEA